MSTIQAWDGKGKVTAQKKNQTPEKERKLVKTRDKL